MRLDFHGRLTDEKEIKAGFIGCGSHSIRNIYPTFQFTNVDLLAVCDLDHNKAAAFAKQFGAVNVYTDYTRMLKNEELDAVFIVTGYDEIRRPTYPKIAIDCMEAGCHVWMEKPPAATSQEIRDMMHTSHNTGKNAMVGLKKMFFPANEKAYELIYGKDFGTVSMTMIQYPQKIPTVEEFDLYLNNKKDIFPVMVFLDHLCHPVSLLIYLMGMPASLYYERNIYGAGMALFEYDSGASASIAFTSGAAINDGLERTVIISDNARHVVVDNNIRVSYHRMPKKGLGYGDNPNAYIASKEETTATWEPEFSLGQLYNKGLFLLGYYNEINEFASAILHDRKPVKGTLEQAWQVTRIFECFAKGPGKKIMIGEK